MRLLKTNSNAYSRKRLNCISKGNFAAALPLLHRAYGLQPEDYFVNLLLGIDSLRTGDAKGSVSFLRKASRLRPKEEYPLAYLGEAYARQTLFAEAASAYLKAVEVAPGSSSRRWPLWILRWRALERSPLC